VQGAVACGRPKAMAVARGRYKTAARGQERYMTGGPTYFLIAG
jgi:hypothetical protein